MVEDKGKWYGLMMEVPSKTRSDFPGERSYFEREDPSGRQGTTHYD